ncbi:SRPBCC domain-containing protein [Pedobacter psychrodurus]|uniref:SRPBCC domain-containing protein n=1 Tax=Pedobacter psychrodurus TaxID=2530456 RepID=A0A4R0PZI4_9SPHI|nr:SRPBCC domain-containing protein [Pedobacter psychrodurus]TCD28670.1 SRPBCC domain-containing protein [Pedobacter psychrodurus]
MEIKTQIEINATPDKVWAILTDFENYRDWNPFIKSITGKPVVGNRITVSIAPPNSKVMTFKPVVLIFKIDKEFRWIGKLLFKGVFDGEHKFELIDNANGTTTFNQCESFSGILVGLFKKQLETNTRAGFEQMNENLKQQVETSLNTHGG